MTTYICPTCGIGAVNAIHSESGKEPNEFTVARAAPDLLEACEALVKEIIEYGDKGWYDEVGNLVSNLQAAIAAAKGE
jgi:hypothetical protein